LANVGETDVVEENLLDDEDGDSFAEFRAGFHDAKAKRNDFGGKKEVNHFRGVVLDESANDAKGCKAEVLKRSRF
jgi:hypothetical protein